MTFMIDGVSKTYDIIQNKKHVNVKHGERIYIANKESKYTSKLMYIRGKNRSFRVACLNYEAKLKVRTTAYSRIIFQRGS